jgi:hypothetical protein
MATNYTLWIHVIKILHSHWEYTVDLFSRKLKFGHSHETHKVDLCVNTNHKCSIATWTKMIRSRVFNFVVRKYESSHVIIGAEVEHGRNHLIADL